MKKIIFSAIFFSTFLFVISCKKDEVDTQKPIINLIEPEDGDTLNIGETVHFEVEFSDNTELKSYKVEVHNNFDGHNHKPQSTDSIAWTYSNTWMIEAGKRNTYIHHHEITIPDSLMEKVIIPGNYHFGLYCTDVSGNESHVFKSVILGHGAIHSDKKTK